VTDTLDRLKAALGDRYAIQREIGRGGMAAVFLAKDLKHARDVALKVLRPEVAASVGKERFEQEIRIAARLTHPNILPLHDSGEADGLLYFVMAYAEGGALRARMEREGQLGLEDALVIARAVAAALDYAHRHDVIHRDIKPENIMIHDGVAMVTDFGIGKALSAAGAERITLPGAVVGTPTYMSPEQVAGEVEIDSRTDIYSLGSLLYEMLAGEPPYTGPSAQAIMLKRLHGPPAPLRERRPGIAPAVERAVATALAADPNDRFATAAEFARVLAAWDDESIVRTPTSHSWATASADESIAVLPFTNLSADPENEYLSYGITEEIINALTKIEGLGVVSRTSAFAFKGRSQDIRRIGEQLNVTSVLEGSVRRAGNRLRISAQLTNVADGYHHWSERYDREIGDVFAIQDEIAEAIVTTLKGQLAAEKHARSIKRYTANVEAYELYLKGRYVQSTRRRRGITKGIEYFEQAIHKDPNYALAYTGLADSYYLLAWYRFLAPHDAFTKARAAAARALEIDEELPEAHTSQGFVSFYYDWDWAETERAFERALELNPTDSTALHAYAEYMASRNRLDEAFAMIQRAHQLDPLSLTINAGLGWIHYFSRRYDRAIQQFERTLDLNPEYVFLNWFLGQACLKNGMPEQAVDAFRRGMARSENHSGMAAYLGFACAQGGRSEEALDILRDLETRANEVYVPSDYLSVLCLGLGRTDEAIQHLEKGCDERALHLVFLGVDPLFDDLRSNAKFTQILRTIGVEQTGRD
jgi:serine/threonine-protein kinase